jgi:hypothetical protein
MAHHGSEDGQIVATTRVFSLLAQQALLPSPCFLLAIADTRVVCV